MRNHGTDPQTRFQVLRERVQALKTIWTQDEPAYHGKFVDFDPIWLWPKPVQPAGPPVLIGGAGPRVLDRVVEYGDGWIPSTSSGIDQVLARIPELNRRAEAAGRGRLPVTITSTPPDPAVLERYREAGVERAGFALPQGGRDAVLPVLDQLAQVSGEFR
jgi:alkanesulfonate monooxygenase SsuD/methylene tetrahydromethanopterin reductase-like flavin-dependent oxidoreductase (luciferase family)